ncbi:MAG TPA: hypothetical protein PKW33_01470 [Anaerolineaceae bacterium]|nr:hypothetical protein [Anaerolineaceae bacterium]HPN50227.1 hypothetical protein [Anaerolineaceae bacterium]
MYLIQKTEYGYHITFSGTILAEEMLAWLEESRSILARSKEEEFGVLVDMRALTPLDKLATQHMISGQALYKSSGMIRSAVILSSPVLTLQFLLLARASGIYHWERYLDASRIENCEKAALDWIINGIDPDEL